jgi:cation diffusion facilitator family transporter
MALTFDFMRLRCRAVADSTKPFRAGEAAARRSRGPGIGARLALIGVVVNFFLAVIKITAGILGHCYALIADGIESTLDIFGSLAIWFGLKVAAEPPDETHPYGHGKAEPLASVAVALAVIAAAIALAVKSVREIITPHHAPAPFTLAVLVLVIVVKETLFRKVAGAAAQLGSGAVKTDAWHHRSDAITSAGAFIGISVALIGGPGWEAADDWAALFTCGIIGFNGWRLLMPAVHEVMDTAPPKEVEDSVRAVAQRVAGVLNVEKCRLRKMGTEFYVDIHIGVDADLTVRAGHQIGHDVKDAIRAANSAMADVLVHIEPIEPATK